MKTMTLILALAVAGSLSLAACERTVSEETKVKSSGGSTSVEKKTVTQNPDTGQTTVTKERKEVRESP